MAKGIIQYTKDIINDSIIGTKTTYSSKKIEELLNGDKFIKTDNILTEKTIGNTQVLSYTDLVSSINDIKVDQLVYDTNEILAKVNSIDTPTGDVTLETIHANTSDGSEDAFLTEDITSNVLVGAAPANTLFKKDTTFTEFAKKILLKEIAPSINVTATNSGVYVVNTQIGGTTINLKINSLGTSTPTSIEFYIDGTLIDTQAYTAGKMNYSTDYSTVITSATPKTVTATAKLIYDKSDGNTTNVLGNKTIVFVYPSFSGITSLDSTTITETDIKAMTKLALTSKFYTASGVTMSNQRTIFVYPQTYGNLTSIKDVNNFEYLQSYDKTTITIDGVLCNAYILHDPVTVTNFKQIYN